MYTDFVKKNIITLDRLVELMSLNASKRFNIELDGFTAYDLNCQYAIDPESFATMGRSTPFTGKSVYGKCMATVCGGKIAYIDEKIMKDR